MDCISRKLLSPLVLCIVVCFVFGCEPDDDIIREPIDPGVIAQDTVPIITASGDERFLNEPSSYIFDQSKLSTFEINLPQKHLNQLDSDPAAEVYVEGSLTFEGETISPVGIRYKGSIGAFVDCVSGPDFSNPSGKKTCTKLSMKVKINWEGNGMKFFGLKKLQFHSMNQDPTQMRDRLAYQLFRDMGVPAPRAVHAKLLINGEFSGVYALVEQIDNRWAKENFVDDSGNLYKEIWPINDLGALHPANDYLNALRTNEENPSLALIQSFASGIGGSTEANRKSIIEKWMDIPEIMAYTVVDRTIRADDGAFHWYCNSGRCEPHNFYWYEDPTRQKFHLIPWDMDHTFENIISDENPVVPIADDWGEITNDCEPFSHGAFQLKQRSAACDKIVAAWLDFDQEFQQKKVEFINGPLSMANTDQLLEAWTAQIRDATQAASDLHDDALIPLEWESALTRLKSRLEYARTH